MCHKKCWGAQVRINRSSSSGRRRVGERGRKRESERKRERDKARETEKEWFRRSEVLVGVNVVIECH